MKRFVRILRLLLLGVTLASGTARGAGDDADPKKIYMHKLALGDSIRVSVFGEEDLLKTVRIDARGQIDLALVGQVSVGGMTIEQAKVAIENAYKEGRFLRNPQVSINVESYTPREITVQGQVRNPQRISLPPESSYTISEVIAKTGGFTDIAKGSEVTIRRPMPNGTFKVFIVNVDNILKGKKGTKVEDDFLLEPNDIVYVPERLI
ncbi:MAG: polysaccharide biosynthesis/export family protein [Opitutaceae bacterium]|nr:polysaccharide biosynthesis/export family protein [Opitutaceae bacterium]